MGERKWGTEKSVRMRKIGLARFIENEFVWNLALSLLPSCYDNIHTL